MTVNQNNFTKDKQTVLPGGVIVCELIHDVCVKEMPNIITRNGCTTEIFRNDWGITPYQIVHMIHVSFRANAISAWHFHKLQTDHIFVTQGTIKLVLYDIRENSPSKGVINIFHLSRMRPTIITIPPNIIHGLQNLEATESSFINFFDKEYNYEDPDEYRLPPDSDLVPYKF